MAASMLLMLFSAQEIKGQNNTASSVRDKDLSKAGFSELFREVKITDIEEDVFRLFSQDFSILTAGTPTDFNSMVAGWGGWGTAFNRQQVFHFLRSNRYTLEKMREQGRYTITFFPDSYKAEIMKFGTTSGRDSDKMKKTALHPVETPSGNMAFKEAKIIIECTLSEVTTVNESDFSTPEDKKFISDAYKETGEYHKVVFGTIDKVWMK